MFCPEPLTKYNYNILSKVNLPHTLVIHIKQEAVTG